MRDFFLTLSLGLAVFGLTACKEAEPTASSYQMGEPVPLGHFTYTVFERQWMTQLGAGLDARVPQNRFYLIRISAVNSGGDAAIIPVISLVDDTGSAFSELQNGEGFPDFLGSLRMVAPAEKRQGNLVFDVPPKHYKLKLSEEDGKQISLVDLPLSFDSDAPDIIAPLSTDHGKDPTKK
jgi:hypothetical protein